MNFKKELAKFGYNKGNSIDVETLIDEILPELFKIKKESLQFKNTILIELWTFCEKEFKADFENDYINGYGSKIGMSERTEKFAEKLSKKIIKECNARTL